MWVIPVAGGRVNLTKLVNLARATNLTSAATVCLRLRSAAFARFRPGWG